MMERSSFNTNSASRLQEPKCWNVAKSWSELEFINDEKRVKRTVNCNTYYPTAKASIPALESVFTIEILSISDVFSWYNK